MKMYKVTVNGVAYEIAVEEGATMVRVGTAIFGERNYNI